MTPHDSVCRGSLSRGCLPVGFCCSPPLRPGLNGSGAGCYWPEISWPLHRQSPGPHLPVAETLLFTPWRDAIDEGDGGRNDTVCVFGEGRRRVRRFLQKVTRTLREYGQWAGASDTPIAEQLHGMAVGARHDGLRPIVEGNGTWVPVLAFTHDLHNMGMLRSLTSRRATNDPTVGCDGPAAWAPLGAEHSQSAWGPIFSRRCRQSKIVA